MNQQTCREAGIRSSQTLSVAFLTEHRSAHTNNLQGVFTYLLENLGVKNVQFEELISLDSQSLGQLSPLGVIFLFKYNNDGRKSDGPLDGQFDFEATYNLDDAGSGGDGKGKVWFAAQTIQNACGTQALLSVLMNKDNKDGVELGPHLTDFKEFTAAFPPDVCLFINSRACQLYTDHLRSVARLSATAISSVTPTTPSPAARPSSQTKPVWPLKTMTSSTSSHTPASAVHCMNSMVSKKLPSVTALVPLQTLPTKSFPSSNAASNAIPPTRFALTYSPCARTSV